MTYVSLFIATSPVADREIQEEKKEKDDMSKLDSNPSLNSPILTLLEKIFQPVYQIHFSPPPVHFDPETVVSKGGQGTAF